MMFFIIILMAIVGLIATDLFVPSLPALAEVFHQTPNHVQLTISLFLLGFGASQLFYGPISDRVGRKMPIIVGIALFVIGSVLCLFAHSFTVLCIARIIQGVGSGTGLSLARVVLFDLYKGVNLAVKSAHMSIFITLSPGIAPVIGGWLQEAFGYKGPFAFMLAFGIILILLMIFVFRETIEYKDPHLNIASTLVHYKKILKNFMFMRYVIVSGFSFAAIIVYANIVPFIAQNQLHLTAAQTGYILLLAVLGLVSTALLGSKLVKRFHPYYLIVMGLLILLASGILMIMTVYAFGTHLYILLPLLFLTTMSCGLLFPNALALAFSQLTAKIGIAGAIYGTFQILTTVIVNFILNNLTHQNQSLIGIFYVIMGVAGLTLVLCKKHTQPQHQGAGTPVIE